MFANSPRSVSRRPPAQDPNQKRLVADENICRPPVYHKHTANRSPKPNGHSLGEQGKAMSRYAYQVDAQLESDDHTKSELSKSLFDLLPQHANNTDSPIQTALRSKSQDGDVEILYSFDNKGPSPGEKGRQVDLGGLVEKAEQKWVAQQTDRIVRGEYEVLDEEGETMTVSKSKFKKSPKQKTIKSQPRTVKGLEGEEDDGFELI